MSILPRLLFILPLELDILGVSISLGMKSRRDEIATAKVKEWTEFLSEFLLIGLGIWLLMA